MNKEETLRQIKEAEASARQTKADAEQQRESILRAARQQALTLRDSLRAEVDKRQDEILKAAEAETVREKEAVLARGRGEAEALAAQARANLDRAVDRLVEKFREVWNA